MFYSLIDFIVCPHCKRELTLLMAVEQPQHTAMRMRTAQRANPPGASVGPLPAITFETQLARLLAPLAATPATDRRDREVGVVQGILCCLQCERWYPIRDGLPELLPDHLRMWNEERAWLKDRQPELAAAGLQTVWEIFWAHAQPTSQTDTDDGAHYKRAEMTVTQRLLPEGYFGAARVAPFFPVRPSFSLDLIARYVTTVSRLDCGLNGTVFDLGVGYAWTTEWLARLGYQPIGVDICRDYMLMGLSRMGVYVPHLVVGDNENLPLRDECVDTTLSFDAFHHLPNRPRAMSELARIMKSGTKLVLVEPGGEHEAHPQSQAVMKQHGILERGFTQADLASYIQGTPFRHLRHFRSDTHPHDVFTVQKAGQFITDSLNPRALVAELLIQPSTLTTSLGSRPELVVTITNCGDTIWLNRMADGHGEVHLGAHLFDQAHNLLREDYARILLPRAISPGERVRLQCALPPLQRSGQYVVEFDMVDNGLLWFKDYAPQSVNWHLTIVGADIADINTPLVTDVAPRIVPKELPVEQSSMVFQLPGNSRKTVMQLWREAWLILRLRGLVALWRKGMEYMRWRLAVR